MATANVEAVVKYVSHKVSKVRWKPLPSGAIGSSDIFVSGSWNDEVNRVCVWRFHSDAQPADLTSIVEPVLLCEWEAGGADIMDLLFTEEEGIVAALASGSVVLLRFRPAVQSLGLAQVWEELHSTGGEGCPCTAVAVSGSTIVTGGEDGRMNVLRTEDQHPIRTIEKAESATLTALVCSLQLEVVSASSSGQLKIWDLRRPGNTPARVLVVLDEFVSAQSLARHPHQPHLVAVGRGDGSLCFWDLRQDRQPLSLIQAHSSDVWELRFHQAHPNNLFSCSQDGSLWHWDASGSQLPNPVIPHHPASVSKPRDPSVSPWISGAVAQGKVDIANYLSFNRMPVNSLDIESKHLVCGTDGEALFVVPDLTLR